jgi:hypothetical protein
MSFIGRNTKQTEKNNSQLIFFVKILQYFYTYSISKDEAKKRGIGKAKSDFYFVDYKNFCDVLRWKLYHLKHLAAKEPTAIQDSYVCHKCDKK